MTRSLQPLRVLHVDDDAVNRLVLGEMLRVLGHQPEPAASGAEALARLATEAFDVLMTDVHMPQLDGSALLARLRAGGGLDPALPVIAISADVLSQAPQAYVALGFCTFLGKPLSLASIEEGLRRAVAGPAPLTHEGVNEAARALARAARWRGRA